MSDVDKCTAMAEFSRFPRRLGQIEHYGRSLIIFSNNALFYAVYF
ncbi:hypothetical protein [Rhizobium lentis]|nr:hypothetical protein [Rhizobium lentis]